jgi:hypothetical protein
VWAEVIEEEDGVWGGSNDYGRCRATVVVTKSYDESSSRPAYETRASRKTRRCFRKYER